MNKLIKIGDLFRGTWSLYKENFVLLFSLMFLPCLLLELDPLMNNIDPSFSVSASGLIVLVSGLLMIWAGIAVVLVLTDEGKSLKLAEAYQKSWVKFWPLVWVAVISSFVIGGGFALFIIPGLIFAVYFMFAKMVAIVENKKGLASLMQSREYVRGYFWAIVWRYLVILISSTIVYALVSLLLHFLIGEFLPSSLLGIIVSSVLTVIANALVFPIMITAVYLVYKSLREVKGEIAIDNANKKALPYLFIALIGWAWLFIFIFFLFTVFMTFLISFLTSSAVTQLLMNTSSTLPY